MAKRKELDALLTELSEHSAGIAEAVRDIRVLLSFNEAEEAAGQAPEKKPCTLEELRAVLLEKRKAGFKDEIKALLAAHGADRLTEIDPGEYDAMMAEAEGIGR